ncbi:MAG: Uma2 family endonuclease [Acidobacteria bacterium]|nr:Uma2 family endonuclease [Acidobacteriota bacterium]
MVTTTQDFKVLTLEDFERLPEDGMFEVVDGRAILFPGGDIPHQKVCMALYEAFRRLLRALGYGYVWPTVNVFIPRPHGALGEVQNRVPDLVVSGHEPAVRFAAGDPPDLVIEVLSTRRGNVERTEKLDDYALAGIGEYWIVDPFDRAVEVYLLEQGEYVLQERQHPLHPRAFPSLELDPKDIWAALD